ncbi:MAG: hypothetical protein HRU24_04870 [Gammaproteobacteria bacterium]|nr:hypothetical protein [Gammaproteobacteria bacterium]
MVYYPQKQPDCLKQQQAFKRWIIPPAHQSTWQQICQIEQFFSPINHQMPSHVATQTLLTSSSNTNRNISRRGAIKGLFSLAFAVTCIW